MLSLSPLKMIVVLLVALVLVGPDKLPGLARQIGGAWKAFRSISSKLEDEVRSTMPDLPSAGDIARFARSPVALLDSLAQLEDTELTPDPGAEPIDHSEHLVADPGAPPPVRPAEVLHVDEAEAPPTPVPDTADADPSTGSAPQQSTAGLGGETTHTRSSGDRPPPSGFDPSLN